MGFLLFADDKKSCQTGLTNILVNDILRMTKILVKMTRKNVNQRNPRVELSKARMESRQGKRRKRRRKKREEIEKGEGQMPLYNRLKEYRARLEVNQA